MDERCRKCRLPLVTHEEHDYGLCEDCIENAIEKSIEDRDWNCWHSEG